MVKLKRTENKELENKMNIASLFGNREGISVKIIDFESSELIKYHIENKYGRLNFDINANPVNISTGMSSDTVTTYGLYFEYNDIVRGDIRSNYKHDINIICSKGDRHNITLILESKINDTNISGSVIYDIEFKSDAIKVDDINKCVLIAVGGSGIELPFIRIIDKASFTLDYIKEYILDVYDLFNTSIYNITKDDSDKKIKKSVIENTEYHVQKIMKPIDRIGAGLKSIYNNQTINVDIDGNITEYTLSLVDFDHYLYWSKDNPDTVLIKKDYDDRQYDLIAIEKYILSKAQSYFDNLESSGNKYEFLSDNSEIGEIKYRQLTDKDYTGFLYNKKDDLFCNILIGDLSYSMYINGDKTVTDLYYAVKVATIVDNVELVVKGKLYDNSYYTFIKFDDGHTIYTDLISSAINLSLGGDLASQQTEYTIAMDRYTSDLYQREKYIRNPELYGIIKDRFISE